MLDEGASPEGAEEKGAWKREEEGGKKKEGWGVTFEQCRQEVMTQFSSRAVKHRTKKWKQRVR